MDHEEMYGVEFFIPGSEAWVTDVANCLEDNLAEMARVGFEDGLAIMPEVGTGQDETVECLILSWEVVPACNIFEATERAGKVAGLILGAIGAETPAAMRSVAWSCAALAREAAAATLDTC